MYSYYLGISGVRKMNMAFPLPVQEYLDNAFIEENTEKLMGVC